MVFWQGTNGRYTSRVVATYTTYRAVLFIVLIAVAINMLLNYQAGAN